MRSSLHYILLALLTFFVWFAFITRPGINGYPPAMFGEMVYGTAHKPYVYRALIPGMIRVITALIPPHIRSLMTYSEVRILNWETNLLPEYLVASVIFCALLVGFYFAMKYFFRGIFQTSNNIEYVVSLMALAGLPTFFRYYNYIYDFATLFLFTLGLGFMVHRNWRMFLLVYLLACLNKETTILLTLVFTFYFFRRWTLINKRKFIQLSLFQLAIFLSTRLGMMWIFRNNLGSPLEFHLLDHNIHLFSHPYSLTGSLMEIGLLIFCAYKWAEKPPFLKHGAVILIPLLGATLFWGFFDELRDFYEAYPIIVLLIFDTVGKLFRLKFVSLPAPSRIPAWHEFARSDR